MTFSHEQITSWHDGPILIVEDDAAVRRVTARMLEAGGYRVLEAEGTDHAIRIGQDRDELFHLVVTDIVLPQGMNGVDLVELLRQERPEMRALFVSGWPEHPALQQVKNAYFLAKPFSMEALFSAVRKAMSGGAALAA